jgi:hypothetical protein
MEKRGLIVFLVLATLILLPGVLAQSYARVFVTNQSWDGGLGGLFGADAKCQAAANATGLGSTTWKAWLSDSTTSASSRLIHSNVTYKRIDGVTIANNWADLIDGTLINPINKNEFGQPVGEPSWKLVWTGTNSDGTLNGWDCGGWTGYGESTGAVGNYSSINSGWTLLTYAGCAATHKLYCFEQITTNGTATNGTLSVVSTPSGANIYVDLVPKGTTPTPSPISLAPRGYSVKLTKTGFQDYTAWVTITSGQNTFLNVTLIPVSANSTNGTLNITSVPMAASIYIRGYYRGQTPYVINLAPGNYDVSLIKQGYGDYWTSVTITSGQTTYVNAILVQNGTLNITSSPLGASITDNGLYAGLTPKDYMTSSGNHTITLTKSGFLPYTTTVEVFGGQTTYVNGILSLDVWCNDTDGGLNMNVRGTATDYTGTSRTDSCSKNGYLTEYYCDQSTTKVTSTAINCGGPKYCVSGRCTMQQAPAPVPIEPGEIGGPTEVPAEQIRFSPGCSWWQRLFQAMGFNMGC